MNVELKGTLKVISAEERVSDNFSKKEIVVTVDEDTQYPQDIVCQAINKQIELITADFKMGGKVIVSCNLRGRASNGKYYNQLVLWSIKKA
jgi:hypothetical protein